ncbi:MAG: transglycosylase SLT domain-containing protein [Alphaproteobacteria bacterium]
MRFLLLSLAALLLTVLPGAARAESQDPRAICRKATDLAEKAMQVPSDLLYAIALVESGRSDPETGERFAWPWTVNSGGDGRYYPDMATAIRAVEALQRKGVTNIDVGCMQVNLHFHGDAFDSLKEAFDPVNNVAYATTFLSSLQEEDKSWNTAVKHYHSRNAEKHVPYRNKVYSAWREARDMGRDAAKAAPAPARPVRVASAGGIPVTDKVGIPAAKGAVETASTRYLSQWPPRNVSEQMRVQAMARSFVMAPR